MPLRRGFMYLVAVIDWYSRYVLSWELSNTLDSGFCVAALEAALAAAAARDLQHRSRGAVHSQAFTGRLESAGIAISMDGRGRALDNVFIERLWRSVKYENIYLHGYETAVELERGLASYFDFYCYERLHMALGYRTPWEVYSAGPAPAACEMKTFWRKKFWPAARLSSYVKLDPIRVRSSAAARDLGGVSRAEAHTLTHPKTCPTIGVHLRPCRLLLRITASPSIRVDFLSQKMICHWMSGAQAEWACI